MDAAIKPALAAPAAPMAMISRSRISPNMITSGSGDDLAARFPLIGHDSVQARASLEAEAEAARQLADAASVPTPVPVAIGKDKLRTGRPGRVAVNRSCG